MVTWLNGIGVSLVNQRSQDSIPGQAHFSFSLYYADGEAVVISYLFNSRRIYLFHPDYRAFTTLKKEKKMSPFLH